MLLNGNGGGTGAVLPAMVLSGGSIFLHSSGSTLVVYLFLGAIVLSSVLSMAMLVRFSINFIRNGKDLSKRHA